MAFSLTSGRFPVLLHTLYKLAIINQLSNVHDPTVPFQESVIALQWPSALCHFAVLLSKSAVPEAITAPEY